MQFLFYDQIKTPRRNSREVFKFSFLFFSFLKENFTWKPIFLSVVHFFARSLEKGAKSFVMTNANAKNVIREFEYYVNFGEEDIKNSIMQ